MRTLSVTFPRDFIIGKFQLGKILNVFESTHFLSASIGTRVWEEKSLFPKKTFSKGFGSTPNLLSLWDILREREKDVEQDGEREIKRSFVGRNPFLKLEKFQNIFFLFHCVYWEESSREDLKIQHRKNRLKTKMKTKKEKQTEQRKKSAQCRILPFFFTFHLSFRFLIPFCLLFFYSVFRECLVVQYFSFCGKSHPLFNPKIDFFSVFRVTRPRCL